MTILVGDDLPCSWTWVAVGVKHGSKEDIPFYLGRPPEQLLALVGIVRHRNKPKSCKGGRTEGMIGLSREVESCIRRERKICVPLDVKEDE